MTHRISEFERATRLTQKPILHIERLEDSSVLELYVVKNTWQRKIESDFFVSIPTKWETITEEVYKGLLEDCETFKKQHTI